MREHYRVKRYKHPRLKYVVRGKISGKWFRKYFETKAEAETFCEQKNTEVANQGVEALEFSSELRVMAQRCASRLEPFGKTIEDAVNHYIEQLSKAQKAIPLTQAIAELIENRRAAGASDVYCYDLTWRLGRFERSFPERSTDEFSTRDIEQWLVGLNVGPVTRNTYRRDLRTLFSYCHERGFASSNPVAAASRAKEVANPVGILAVEELSRLLAVASPKIIPFLAIGAFAGLRAAEVSRLDWAQIDLADGLIEVTARNSKTAQRRLVTILPNLKAWLEPYRQLSGPVAPLNLRKLLRGARKGANIAEWPSNALRHSYASYHLAHFRDAAALALQMGHTRTNLIFQHYREVVKPKEASRYWNIFPNQATENVVAFASA